MTKHVKEWMPIEGEPVALAGRCLTLDTCTKWGYTSGIHNGDQVQIANYRDADGALVGQKLRFKGKKFSVNGTISETLYGRHLWPDGGRMVVITEGEIDALSMSQVQGNKWPVVSLPNGSASARKAISANIEWLSKFDSVILMFDMDEAGRAAVEDARDVLPPGRVRVASLPLKDPNEMLKAGRVEELVQAMWQAKTYRPDGIVGIEDVIEKALAPIERGMSWWLTPLDDALRGRKLGEVIGIGAGTGVGKTAFCCQQAAHDIEQGHPTALFFLESTPAETALRVAGALEGKAFHDPQQPATDDEKRAAMEKLRGKLWLYDSWGTADWDTIATKIRYLAAVENVKLFTIDHLTALVDTGNERESLEGMMKSIASLANELQVVITFVSHLASPEGKSHEEGGRVTIKNFKGSRSIGFWAWTLIGLERDQQSDDPDSGATTVRILKDRKTGTGTGRTFAITYNHETSRLEESDVFVNNDFN